MIPEVRNDQEACEERRKMLRRFRKGALGDPRKRKASTGKPHERKTYVVSSRKR